MHDFTDAELAAFLDEELSPARSSLLEQAIRGDDSLRRRLIEVRGRSMAGLHTIGSIWRRRRLSCPDRKALGQFLLGTLDASDASMVRFHLNEIGCRFCNANLDDLTSQMNGDADAAQRRNRWFQTSKAGVRRTED